MKRRTMVWLGGATVLAILIAWQPLQQAVLLRLLLRTPAPSSAALTEIADVSKDPASLLKRFWATGRVPHRRFVLKYLQNSRVEISMLQRLEPLALEGTQDPDIQTREIAFAALGRLQSTNLRSMALAQLGDSDPAVRLLGLQALRKVAGKGDAATVAGLLKDQEPRVVVAALAVLKQVTGKDTGVRFSDAQPRFIGPNGNEPQPANLGRIKQAVEDWTTWWREHELDYPKAEKPSRAAQASPRLPVPRFTLADLKGQRFDREKYRDSPWLVLFWSPDAPASLNALSNLASAVPGASDSPRVVAIGLPEIRPCAHGEPGHGSSGHDHSRHSSGGPDAAAHLRAEAEKLAREMGIKFPMLLDPTGEVGLSFGVEDRPGYVLADARGFVRRQFIGNRPKQILARMIGEIGSAAQEPRRR